MLATNVRTSGKSVVALIALAAVSLGRHHGPRPSSSPVVPAVPVVPVVIDLHVKLRAPGARLSITSAAPTPLFMHLPAGTRDGRERWIQLAVPVPDGPARAVAAVLADPAVEVAFVPPVTTLATEGAAAPDRRHRDSGAILVGAGGPPRDGFADRVRLEFSNYGSRVDVQGWGRKVATLDYGDLQACAGDHRHYTGEFSGTSSASPIVAGAAVILEGVARERGRVLGPTELRALLRRTGTPQAGDTSRAIGPRPDLARAIRDVR